MAQVKYVTYLVEPGVFMLALVDKTRAGASFACRYQISAAEMKQSVVDPRERYARNAERMLWQRVKIEQPGTFLDARALGYVSNAE